MSDQATALKTLCLGVLPIWGRQLETSRVQSEAAVTEMLTAFATIGPHLEEAVRRSHAITQAMAPLDDSVGMSSLPDFSERELNPLLAELGAVRGAPIRRVLDLMRKAVQVLESATQPLSYDADAVNSNIERMYVGFQYQDRINQMMNLLQEDITRLHQLLEDAQAAPDALALQPWLDHLESLYAMTEQHRAHSNGGAVPDSDTETSFF